MPDPGNHTRTIRSFVRREGRMTRSQQRALDKLLPRYGLPLDALIEPADIFGRSAPLTLEIGFGNGDSLATMAAQDPASDFIGIEVHRPGVGHLLLELERQGITNVRVFTADAIEVVKCCIPDHSLNRVLLFFPDPWPKKRHHKRRFINPSNLDQLARIMAPGAILRLATDIGDYVRHALEALDRDGRFVWLAEGPVDWRESWPGWPGTRYEAKALREGRTPHYLSFRRL